VDLPDFARILDSGLVLGDFARAAACWSSQARWRNPPSGCCPCPSPSGAGTIDRTCQSGSPRSRRVPPRDQDQARPVGHRVRKGDSMRLGGKVAVVTGGGSGIGRGIVLCLAREGADIAVADLQEANAESAAREVQALGRTAIGLRCDVTR